MNKLKRFLYLSLACGSLFFLTAANCSAQANGDAPQIRLDNLKQFEGRAAKVIDISLNERLLRVAERFLSDKDPDTAKVKEVLRGVRGVYVRSYQFDAENQYQPNDIESIRSQLNGGTWERLVGVRSKNANENIEVFIALDNTTVRGLVILSAQPKQLMVINIVGTIDPAKLAELNGAFGIPRIEIHTDKDKP